jgi:hypothetical protein
MLLRVNFFNVFAVETQENTELSSSIGIGLPNVLILAMHGMSHHLISVCNKNKAS